MNDGKSYASVSTRVSDPKLSFRVPKKLKMELIQCAQRSGRTLNAEIILRLLHSLGLYAFITEVPLQRESSVE